MDAHFYTDFSHEIQTAWFNSLTIELPYMNFRQFSDVIRALGNMGVNIHELPADFKKVASKALHRFNSAASAAPLAPAGGIIDTIGGTIAETTESVTKIAESTGMVFNNILQNDNYTHNNNDDDDKHDENNAQIYPADVTDMTTGFVKMGAVWDDVPRDILQSLIVQCSKHKTWNSLALFYIIRDLVDLQASWDELTVDTQNVLYNGIMSVNRHNGSHIHHVQVR